MRRAVLLLVVLLALGGLALLVLQDDQPAAQGPSVAELAPGATTPAEVAAAACVRLRLVEQGIRANSSASTVRTALGEARLLAAEAARRDATWLGLSGGVAALDEAVRRDDGRAAGIGLRSARAACAPEVAQRR